MSKVKVVPIITKFIDVANRRLLKVWRHDMTLGTQGTNSLQAFWCQLGDNDG